MHIEKRNKKSLTNTKDFQEGTAYHLYCLLLYLIENEL